MASVGLKEIDQRGLEDAVPCGPTARRGLAERAAML
jgi:hypothetical protein